MMQVEDLIITEQFGGLGKDNDRSTRSVLRYCLPVSISSVGAEYQSVADTKIFVLILYSVTIQLI